MLPKPYRLPAPGIRNVLLSTLRVADRTTQLIYVRNSRAVSRFAIIASAKADKRAAGRNRIKRLVRESIRLLLPRLTPGWDTVIVARQPFGDVSQPHVQRNLEELLRRAHLFHNGTREQ